MNMPGLTRNEAIKAAALDLVRAQDERGNEPSLAATTDALIEAAMRFERQAVAIWMQNLALHHLADIVESGKHLDPPSEQCCESDNSSTPPPGERPSRLGITLTCKCGESRTINVCDPA